MQAHGPQKGERHTGREREREEKEKEGLAEERRVAHQTSSCSKYTSRSKTEGGIKIYYIGFIRQQTKGQGTLRWLLGNDGKCKQS